MGGSDLKIGVFFLLMCMRNLRNAANLEVAHCDLVVS